MMSSTIRTKGVSLCSSEQFSDSTQPSDIRMVNANPNGKNIWIAASDGDLERVKVCEEATRSRSCELIAVQ